MKKYLLIVATIFLSQNLLAQEEHRCNSFELLQQLKASNPDYAQMFEQSEIYLQKYISTHKNYQSRSVIVIPVVVHLLYNVDSPNHKISDWQITSQIDALNEDYRRLNADKIKTPSLFDSVAADCEIEFCLAKRDPSGNYTTGIRRVATPYNVFPDFNSPKQTATGGDDPWPYTDYLNIWVAPLTYPDLGYSTFPSGSMDASDGVVCHFKAFGRINVFSKKYYLGRTATHEIGHWLNLTHIWGDTPGCSPDDGVSDTPLQDAEHYTCVGFPFTSCSNTSDMYMNYMDYNRDSCMNIFTEGQKERMIAAFNLFRSSILSSQGCNAPSSFANDIGITQIIYPDSTVTGSTFTPIVTLHNFGSSTIISANIFYEKNWKSTLHSFNWSGSLASNASVDVTLPAIADSNWYNIFCAWTKNPNGNQDADTTNDFKTKSYYAELIPSVIAEPVKEVNQQTAYIANSTGTLELNSKGNYPKAFSVYNSIGQQISVSIKEEAANKFQFDFSNFSSGFYFIRITENNQSTVKRVIIQHDF
ncbi:MAG: M43 family zinc metalloprotease [Bacteroidota bacterium]